MNRALPFALLFAVAACGNGATATDGGTDGSLGGTTDGGTDGSSGGSPDLATTASGGYAVVTTADFTGKTGWLNTIKLSDHSLATKIDTTLDFDNDVRCVDAKCYVLDHTHGTVRIYDPSAMWKSPVEIKTGDATAAAAMSNPHDVYPIPGSTRLYVALYNNDAAHAVGVLDAAHPDQGVTKWITIPAATADSDGTPDVNSLYYCNGSLYAVAQDLDSKTFAPTGPGRVVAINPTNDSVVSTLQLKGNDPAALVQAGSDCMTALVADGDNSFGPTTGAGGIEQVSLLGAGLASVVLKDTDLGGHPIALSVSADGKLAFAPLTVDSGASMKVVAVDLAGKKLKGDVTGPATFIPFAKVAPDGSLYVGVASGDTTMGQWGPGVYVGASDGSMVGKTALDLGQGPNAISFF